MRNNAFSIIEILIILVIVGILAAIAFPAYQKHLLKSQVISGVNLLQAYKVPISESFNINGILPTTLTDFQDPKPPINDDYMDKIDLVFNELGSNIQIRLWFKNIEDLASKNITLYGNVLDNGLTWICTTAGNSSEQIATKYLPSSCKSNADAFEGNGSPNGTIEISVN